MGPNRPGASTLKVERKKKGKKQGNEPLLIMNNTSPLINYVNHEINVFNIFNIFNIKTAFGIIKSNKIKEYISP